MGQQDKHNESLKNSIIITKEPQPIWKFVAGSFLYALSFTMVCFIVNSYLEKSKNFYLYLIFFSNVAYLFFAFGIYYTEEFTKYFDFNKMKYKEEIKVAFFKMGKWKNIPKIEYLSVFKGKEYYQVNLWCINNKKINIYAFSEMEPALNSAKDIAKLIKVKILDSTVKGKSKWLDLETLSS